MSTPTPDAPAPRRRRRFLLAAGALLVLVALAAVASTTAGAGDHRSAAATATPSRTAAAPSTPAAPPATASPSTGGTAPTGPSAASTVVDPDQAPPTLPPVPLTAPAAAGDGVTASLVSVEPIQGTASGPGNIGGPALRVTVRLTNGRPAAIPLDGVAVALTHGTDQTPASPLDDPSQAPFGGTLAAGASAAGVYVFTVPADRRDVVTVSVGWQAAAPVMVFTGSAR